MNPIKLNGGGEVEARRATGRLETERVGEGNTAPTPVPANTPQETDSINVSERATAVGELTAKAGQLPDIRQERVEQLRAQVQSGDYHPSAGEIADAIVKDAQGSTGTV